MIVKPPETIEDFEKVRETILELLNNPYCDKGMRESLLVRLRKTESKIEELRK